MRYLLATVALTAALIASTTTDAAAHAGRGDAVGFLGHVVRLLAANDYAAAYPLLHPLQRRLVAGDEYVACESSSPVPGKLVSLRVLRTVHERIHIAGTAQRAPSTAVTFELRLSGALPGEDAVDGLTAHAVAVQKGWAWILSPRRLALHLSGTCGVAAG